ncbi:HlyD family secretion protein [Pedobacter sp. 22163]|uniref:HlyD family secretion protein n=1 Tax=Pedobacter sp. 22163 TaxID=3453883 RepID=UPI003F866078
MAKHFNEDKHSEDLQDIIAKPPSWLLKRGISFVFMVLVCILGLSFVITYPDTINASIKINALNGPKVVINRVPGNIDKIFIKDGETVTKGEVLAFMESTADHQQILALLKILRELSLKSVNGKHEMLLKNPGVLKLGELQASYEIFYQAYISYQASLDLGIYAKNRNFILKDIEFLSQQNNTIAERKKLQEKEFELSKREFERYKKLDEKKVISKSELEEREAYYLNKQYPLNQTASMIIDNKSSIALQRQKLAELDDHVETQKSKFVQSLSSLISETESWIKKYVITAPVPGRLLFSGTIEENQYLEANRDVFFINPKDAVYFGEMYIPQINVGKAKVGQEVLIKVRSFPFQEYGYLKGKISTISEIPLKDSLFFSKVIISKKTQNKRIHLKIGMLADAEILTDNLSIFERISRSVSKAIHYR